MIRIPLTLAAALFAGGAFAQQVGPAPVVAKAAPADYALVAAGAKVAAHRHTLVAPDDAEFAALRANNLREKRLQIGFARELPTSLKTVALDTLAWQTLADGSRIARLEIQSPGAAAVRVAFERSALPKGLTIRAYAPGEQRIAHAPVRAGAGGRVSLPEQRGDVLGLELHAAAGFDWRGAMLPIASVSHLAASPVNWNAKHSGHDEIGHSGGCNRDIACHLDANWQEVGKAVAKYTFDGVNDEGNPATFLCTGTLVNNLADDGAPFFTTANHCIGSAAEAQTMTFYWHFERANCDGLPPTPIHIANNTTSGGADLLEVAAANDMVLLHLNQTPAPDTILSGWNANAPQRTAPVTSLHHPQGDLKKYADGDITDITQWSSNTHTASGTHLRVEWTEGTTEGGSSGAGLFNGAYEFIGTLHGGVASCDAQTEPDWYGRFDQAYESFDVWLGGGGGVEPPPPTVIPLNDGETVHGDLAEGEWHYYSIELPNTDLNRLDAWLTVHAGDADLYLREGQVPSEVHYACRSWESGTADEYCSAVDTTTPGDWYVGVYAYEGEVSYALEVELSRDPPLAPPPVDSGGGGHGGWLIAIGLLGWWRQRRRGHGKSVQIPARAGMGHAEGRRQGPEIR